jgi:ADP-heptose:LPS heptosyltransferase
MMDLRRIIISRTDSIGDVILTLPLAGLLKQKFPGTKLFFLGRSYTEEIIRASKHVDHFINWDRLKVLAPSDAAPLLRSHDADMIIHVFPRPEIARLARKARIPVRLGTTNRLYHWLNCNKLVRLSRKRSSLHEAQLNISLARTVTGINTLPTDEIGRLYGLEKLHPLNKDLQHLIDAERFNLILHPRSKGSAREWGIQNFVKLIEILPPEQYKIFISGTAEEGSMIAPSGIFEYDHVTNLSGKMTLSQLMSFIKACDGLVAASTGPLHLAAALGKMAVGIYPPIRPMHPGRWAPLGPEARYLVSGKECSDCRAGGECHCMQDISPLAVKKLLTKKDININA